tara:strand:+ start:46 stop:432 length:387 start_codon:yes stop_codon:yes gene_type:complete
MKDAPGASAEALRAAMEEEAFVRQALTVTEADYRDAVNALLKLAEGDTGGSRAAAGVLLGLYNGQAFPLDLTDLCALDLRHVQHALIAIRGRVLLAREPHAIVENGDQHFSTLVARWGHLATPLPPAE